MFFSCAAKSIFAPHPLPSQVDTCNALFDEWERLGQTSMKQLAYVLATPYHEVGAAMKPIDEIGRGRGKAYGLPAGPYGHIYFGRGLPQVTWLANYEKASKVVGVDLVRYPERANDLVISAKLQIHGMIYGTFTGARLSDYLTDIKTDFFNARRIINWIDKAEEIEVFARKFWACLGGPAYMPLIKRGTVGQDVNRLQQALTVAGFYTGRVDGDFGPMTEQAVMQYQRTKGLDVDGVVGPDTRRGLGI